MRLVRLLCFAIFCEVCVAHTEKPLVLMISMDGFRRDYLEIAAKHGVHTPNFHSLIETGVVGKMKPVFPSSTFPNHRSIVSGLYSESHGMVGNSFRDPKLGDFRAYINNYTEESNQTMEAKWFKAAEPIWVTNQKEDCDHRSGVYFWPACGAPVENILPSLYERLYAHTEFTERVDKVIDWFVEDEINLGLLYFEQPDHGGHKFGPNSAQVSEFLKKLDNTVAYLVEKLKEHELYHRMNIIILSDHGMKEVKDPSIECIELDSVLDRSTYEKPFGATQMFPKPGYFEEVYSKLKTLPKLKVHRKDDMPPDYHYSNNDRIAPIILENTDGLLVLQNLTEYLAEAHGHWLHGAHGMNNSDPDLQPIFIAHGPEFKIGYESAQQFENVDVYPLLCHILDLVPAPNNGSLERIRDILLPEHSWSNMTVTMATFLVVTLLCVTFTGCFMIGACRASASHKIVRRTVAMQFLNDPPNQKEASVSLLVSDDDDDETFSMH